MTDPQRPRTEARLARAIHNRREATHGPYTDRCICNDDARSILRGAAKLTPALSVEKIIAEWEAAHTTPEKYQRLAALEAAPRSPEPHEELRDWWDSLSDLDQFRAYVIEKSNAGALASPETPEPAPGLDVERLARAWWAAVNEPEDGPREITSEADRGNARAWAESVAAHYLSSREEGERG